MLSDDPEVATVALGALDIFRTQADHLISREEATSLSETQQHALADAIGEDNASVITNLGFKLSTGEFSGADVIKYLAHNPKVKNAVLEAASKNLISLYL